MLYNQIVFKFKLVDSEFKNIEKNFLVNILYSIISLNLIPKSMLG